MAKLEHEAAPGGTQRIIHMAVDKLLLDPDNPRLASTGEAASQFEIAQLLWREMAVDELVMSIAANGFFPEEPLFVMPSNDEADRYIVVEGNRRLAAVLILLNPEWQQRLRIRDIPAMSRETLTSLRTLPVSVYPNREVLWTYLSFRHINSAKPWDAFSKAKYVAHVHDDYGVPLDEIARRIGDRHSTVQRLYRGYKIFRQAEDEAGFDVTDRVKSRFHFSHLYTAVDYPEFQQFLGIDPANFDEERPVDDEHQEELRELMVWLYGKKSANKQPVIRTQNPDLNTLRVVVSNEVALDALRSGYTLERSNEAGIGDERRFRDALTRSREEVQQALGLVISGYRGDEKLFDTGTTVKATAMALHEQMQRIRAERARVV
jgi:hypothetical protein